MDKEKVKLNVVNMGELLNDLVGMGVLDGDDKKEILRLFVKGEIQREIAKTEGVV